ncbi:MAG: [citrate (pro-3S)-lyase] ligase [Lactovum sp.]
MSTYTISKIYDGDKKTQDLADKLLSSEKLKRDKNLDYRCVMLDDNLNVIATGSCFGNTLRCIAVSSKYQGQGLLNEIITHLIQVQFSRHNSHIFLYTKYCNANFFKDLGFYEIIKIENHLVFMENKKTGFSNYLEGLKTGLNLSFENKKKRAAIVINANPFTLGHLYLIEKACSENDWVHIFIVSEDTSLVPFNIRKQLLIEATKHLTNISYHDSGPYIISNSTFPSYFQKDEESVIKGHTLLDISIFKKIANVLNITTRYVGEEPTSFVTNLYNDSMKKLLPENNIECIVVPRKEINNSIISASTVRQAIKEGDFKRLKTLVPQTTYDFFASENAIDVIKKIKKEENIIHY